MNSTIRWLMAAALVLLAGCNYKSQQASTGGVQEVDALPEMVAMARPPIADLPVPVSFHLLEDRSRSFEAAGSRYIDHVYKGSGDKFAVKRFYERQMPISRWVLVTDMFIRGNILMEFEKATERCHVTITSEGMFSGVRIQIAVWTSGPIQVGRGS